MEIKHDSLQSYLLPFALYTYQYTHRSIHNHNQKGNFPKEIPLYLLKPQGRSFCNGKSNSSVDLWPEKKDEKQN